MHDGRGASAYGAPRLPCAGGRQSSGIAYGEGVRSEIAADHEVSFAGDPFLPALTGQAGCVTIVGSEINKIQYIGWLNTDQRNRRDA